MKKWRVVLLLGYLLGGLTASAGISPEFIELNRKPLDRLFDALDPDHPSTGPIAREWINGSRLEAATELATYLGQRSFDTDKLGSVYIPPDYMDHAEAALEGKLFILGEWISIPLMQADDSDWTFRGPRNDKEFAWMLNRHGIFPILAHAWQRSDDPRYRDQLNQLWTDWIRRNPYPGRITFSPQWRSLEVARRILNTWLPVLFSTNEVVFDETRLLATASLLDHATALHKYPSFWGGNHLLTEKTALLALASAFPEFAGAPDWRKDATDTVTREILGQTYPDGSYMELSNHYQRVVLLNMMPFLNLIQLTDPEYQAGAAYQRIEKMWDFFAGSMKPDGTGPLNNASDREFNSTFLRDAWQLFKRPDWLAMASGGREGILPTGSPSRLFPWAGQVFIRSSWDPSGDWIYLDAGPYGTAHQHVDQLHLSVTLNGREILTDSGRYSYQPGPWRDYFKGATAHSILLLDGRPASQGPRKLSNPLDVVFHEAEHFVFASGSSRFDPPPGSLRGPVPWTRSVLYDRRGFVVVFDHLVSFKPHAVDILWQFHPGVNPDEAAAAVRVTGQKQAAGQKLQSGEELPAPIGYYSPEYNERSPAVSMNNYFSIEKPTTFVHVIQDPEMDPVTVTIKRKEQKFTIEFEMFQRGNSIGTGILRVAPRPELTAFRLR